MFAIGIFAANTNVCMCGELVNFSTCLSIFSVHCARALAHTQYTITKFTKQSSSWPIIIFVFLSVSLFQLYNAGKREADGSFTIHNRAESDRQLHHTSCPRHTNTMRNVLLFRACFVASFASSPSSSSLFFFMMSAVYACITEYANASAVIVYAV